MRFDKLTTKFQQALADAQSLALGHDNGFIEPPQLLAQQPVFLLQLHGLRHALQPGVQLFQPERLGAVIHRAQASSRLLTTRC